MSFTRGKKAKSSSDSSWNPTYEPLVKCFLDSKSVRLRSGVEVGHKSVDYFRGQDFVKWVSKHEKDLLTKFPECFHQISPKEKSLTSDEIIELGDKLLQNQFIYRVESADLVGSTSSQSSATTNSKVKWPNRLAYSASQTFELSAFYVMAYDRATSWNYLLLTLIIATVIAVCMFPAWPLMLKLLMWYLLVFVTTILLVLVVLRLIFFILLWYCGYDFWFLPNFFDEQLGVIDSFKPAYSIVYRSDSWGMIIVRMFLAVLTACTLYQLSQKHSIEDIGNFARQQFLDVVDWGHQKLAAPPVDPDSMRFNQRTIANDTIELDESKMFDCMKPCGFQNYTVIEEECLFDCGCVKELLDSQCYSRCPINTKEIFKKAKTEVCEEDEAT